MDLRQRVDFVHDLVDAIKRDVVDRADRMPDDWDGEELRRYVADRFEGETNILARGKVRQNKASRRLAAYHAAVILRGL